MKLNKNHIITLMFLGVSFISVAQVDYRINRPGKKESEIGNFFISAGASIPLGSYRNNDIDNEHSGYAKTGMFVDANLTLNAGKIFGFYFTLYGQGNKLDQVQISDKLAPTQASGSSYSDKNVTFQPWKMGSFFVGPFATIRLSDEILLRPRVLVGVAYAQMPEVEVNVISGSSAGEKTLRQGKQSGDPALAYAIGMGFRFQVGYQTCIFLNFDYMASEFKFKDVVTTSTLPGISSQKNIKQQFEMLNMGLGIGLNMYRKPTGKG